MLKRYVLTGAPGCGKTSILRSLEQWGYLVAQEAATDVIANEQAQGHDEPWTQAGFIDKVVTMQLQRQEEPLRTDALVQVFDRSPLCTLALAKYLGLPITDTLAAEVERMTRERVYERSVFFVRPLGFVAPTAARRISFAESLRFEAIHEVVYRSHGYEIVDIPVGDVAVRALTVAAVITAWT